MAFCAYKADPATFDVLATQVTTSPRRTLIKQECKGDPPSFRRMLLLILAHLLYSPAWKPLVAYSSVERHGGFVRIKFCSTPSEHC